MWQKHRTQLEKVDSKMSEREREDFGPKNEKWRHETQKNIPTEIVPNYNDFL